MAQIRRDLAGKVVTVARAEIVALPPYRQTANAHPALNSFNSSAIRPQWQINGRQIANRVQIPDFSPSWGPTKAP